MKKSILVLVLLVGSLFVSAQGGLDTSVYNKLSEGAKKEIADAQKMKGIENQVESYSKIAGYGKEIGIGVREALTAVKDVTIDLSKSEVGKTTIYLVVWKVAGKDIVRIFIGLFLIIISIFLVSRSYFRTFNRKICIKDNGLFKGKEYKEVESNSFWRYPDSAAICHVVVLVAMLGISAMIMFI